MKFFNASKRPKPGLVLLLLVVIGTVAYYGYDYFQSGSAAGLYLERGGLGYLELGRGSFSGLRITRGYGMFRTSNGGYSNQEVFTGFEKGRLVITARETFSVIGSSGPAGPAPASGLFDRLLKFIGVVIPSRSARGQSGIEFYFVLEPSRTTPGDWDLVACAKRDFHEKSPKVDCGALPLLKTPLPSFLHRAHDPRIADYFSARLANLTDGPLRNADALTAAHPDDPYVATLKLDALLGAGDIPGLEKELARFRTLSLKSKDPFLAHIHDTVCRGALQADQLSQKGQNAYDFIRTLTSRETSLEQRQAQIANIQNYREFMIPLTGLINEKRPVNFLELQTMAKINNIEAVFALLQGRLAQAVDWLAANERAGWLLAQDPSGISQLVAIAIRAITLGGMQALALNACHSGADLALLWQAVSAIANREAHEPVTIANPLQIVDLDHGLALLDGNYPSHEFSVRRKVAETRFAQLQAIVAVRAHQLRTGALPKTATDLAPLLSALPRDPFSTATLHGLPGAEVFTVYSVGPDLKDGGALTEYDPSNGTLSAGDLAVKIPREPEIPFPAGGVHAATAAELQKLFPHGLPLDPFADTKGKRLGVTSTTPVIVYSYGPDTDEALVRPQGASYVPTLAYDPTNGTSSDGDLFIEIPK